MSETLVLVGTAKGLFSLRSSDGRRGFEISGPTLAGEEVYATCIDHRGAIASAVRGLGEHALGPGHAQLRRAWAGPGRRRTGLRSRFRPTPAPPWRGFGS